jgi:methylmalonyl-CoA/ethylmalonyl-CoA epimerase
MEGAHVWLVASCPLYRAFYISEDYQMQAKRIDHVVIAVKDLETAVKTYQDNFGLVKVSEGEVPALGIRNAFLQIGDAQLDCDASPAGGRWPPSWRNRARDHLLSLEVDNLDKAVAELQGQGIRVTVAEGTAGRRLAFVSPKATHGVLLQLLERS